MPLPVMTAPNIDVDAVRLQDARAEKERPSIDVGAGLQPALTGALALQESLDKKDELAAAKVFQREYLDKGLEGAKKLVSEAKMDGKVDPSIYFRADMKPAEAQQAVLMVAKAVKDEVEKADEATATGAYSDLVSKGVKQEDGSFKPATQDELDAAEITAGTKAGKGYEATKAVSEGRTKRKIEADKAAAMKTASELRATTAKLLKGMTVALGKTKDASVVKAIETAQDRISEISTETGDVEEKIQKDGDFDGSLGRQLNDLRDEASSIRGRITGLIPRLSDVSLLPDMDKADKGPKEGDTKTNTKGIKVIYRGGQWQLL